MKVYSPAFGPGEMIPIQYTCDGENINPPLLIESIPEGTKSLAIMIADPDAPMGTFIHWTAWNIPVSGQIRENEVPGVEGLNDFGRHHYGGPCPPSGTHRYYFKVYALSSLLDLPPGTNKEKFEKAVSGLTIGSGEYMGVYKRSK